MLYLQHNMVPMFDGYSQFSIILEGDDEQEFTIEIICHLFVEHY